MLYHLVRDLERIHSAPTAHRRHPDQPRFIQNLLPGLALCVAIGLPSWLIDQTEVAHFGYAGIEAIVLAILLGMALRIA
ncbi:MAG: hypothetical protein WCQ20_12260 [Synechococcaceae cyanobacterium ELA739]|jgi:hypothetical protein